MHSMSRRELIALSSLCAGLPLLTACNFFTGVQEGLSDRPASIGILETTQTSSKSRMVLMDDELNVVYELRVGYANLGQDWQLPVVYDGSLYVIPEGIEGKLDEKKALRISFRCHWGL